MTDTSSWHHLSLRVTKNADGFFVTCSCGWKSDVRPAPPGMGNWTSAQGAAMADRKAHAESVAPENAIWAAGPLKVRPSDYPADHFINQLP